MVPLMSMLRHHLNHDVKKERDIVFLISLRTIDKLLYPEEIAALRNVRNIKIIITLTEDVPQDWNGYSRRIDAEMFEKEFGYAAGGMPMIYVCGPTKFVEAAARLFLKMNIHSHLIKTERFGG
jgi:ferredoxin-NADP reductase